MGQVLASDYVELYTDQPHENSQMNQSMRQSQIQKSAINQSQIQKSAINQSQINQSQINKSVINQSVHIVPKPRPSLIQKYDPDQIKKLKIYVAQPVTNEFPDLSPQDYQKHDLPNGQYYGRIENGKKQGDGVLCLNSKRQAGGNDQEFKFFGSFADGQAEGQGFAIFDSNFTFMGDIKKNEFRGSGILKSVSDTNSYYGEWSNSKLNVGHVFTQHYHYAGQFKNGLREGLGECVYYDGTIIKGNWKQDNLDGKCSIYFPNETSFKGPFVEGVKQGFGYLKTKKYDFYGDFDNNLKNGFGVIIEQKSKNQQYAKQIQNLYESDETYGLMCEFTDPQNKKWSFKNQENQFEQLEHIDEKKDLPQVFGERSFQEQITDLDNEIYAMEQSVGDITKKCITYLGLQKKMDMETQKLFQLAAYQDWLFEQQQQQ